MRDLVVWIVLLSASAFALTAAIGLLRFPDTFTRAHSGTKPQNLGMLLMLIGLAISTGHQAGIIALVFGFQLATAPVAANMVARAAYRSGTARKDVMYADEYAEE